MTIRRRVSIACDAEPFCSAELVGGAVEMTVEDVRRRARDAGWQQSITGDYCPQHRTDSGPAARERRRRDFMRALDSTPGWRPLPRGLARYRRSPDTPTAGDRSAWPVW